MRRCIQAYLIERVAAAPNPRRIGAPLSGERFRQLWRYRVGDYRIIAEIKDAEIMIFVVEIGHRRDIYR